ncbi:ABC transporter substrate-binding protein [Patulibacter minatonensis]|uniref:ABC transporter substrate-binding protein n=1 Tax=Patulibacter minatonensis TaxID=298163 RepID=UPI00047A8513|nr:ABC transporter substrate-binding protein [Patulibacter minatonensis]
MHKKLLAAAVPLMAVGAMTGCGSSSDSGSGGSGGDGAPLKIALIPPSGGPLAVFGKDSTTAWQFAADEANANGGVDGHKVEIVTSQTDGTPAATVRAARKATQGGARFISGVITSPENGALQQQLPSMNAISFNTFGKDDALTGKQCSANAYRTVQNTAMDVDAVAKSLEKLPATKWAIQAVDYATGRTAAKIFTAAAKQAGKQVVLTQYAPLNTTEFGSYITKIKNSGADGVFAIEFGADGVAFVNQGAQFKLFQGLKSVLGFNMVSEPLFDALGDKIEGFYNNIGYVHQLDNAKNRAFVAAWKAKNGGKDPYYVQADAYLGAQTLFEAVKKAKSVDPAKVKTALDSLSFDSIVGQVSIRPGDHQILRDSYLGQVEKQGSGLGWKVINTVPASETQPQADPSCKL